MKYLFSPIVIVRENSVKTSKLKKMQLIKSKNYFHKILGLQNNIEKIKYDSISEIEKFIFENYEKNTIDCKKILEIKRGIYNNRFEKIKKYEYFLFKYNQLKITKKIFIYISKIENIKEKLSKCFEKEYFKSRKILWNECLKNKNILNGLIHYDKSIIEKLMEYSKESNIYNSKKTIKLDDILAKIYTRSILKPSPFSTFCGIEMQINDTKFKKNQNKLKTSKFQVNYVHILRIWDLLIKKQEILEKLHFKINVSIIKTQEGYTISKILDSSEENEKVYNGKTTLLKIPKNYIIDYLYELKKKNKEYSYEELIKEFNFENDNLILFLLEKKYIDIVEKPKEISLNIIEDFINYLLKYKFDDFIYVRELIDSLILINKKLNQMEKNKNYIKRNYLYKEIYDELKNIYSKFGKNNWKAKNLLYEDYISENINRVDFKLNKEIKKTLFLLTDLNIIFDINARVQTTFAEKFKEKYGESKIKTFDKNIISNLINCNNIYTYLWENQMNIKKDYIELNNKIDLLKKELIDYIIEKIENNNYEEEIEIETDYIKKILAKIPNEIKCRKKSYSYFLQNYNEKIVINNIYSGYMIYFSRFLQYYSKLSESKLLKKYINNVFNSNEKICDIRIASGFNGNMRPNISKYELVLPTHLNSFNEKKKEVIDYRKCFYKYDENEKRIKLYNDKIGTFTTVSLGSLMPLYLPGISGLLHSLFINSLGFKDINKINYKKSKNIKYVPRISIGGVVISRRTWIISIEEFNFLNTEEKNFLDIFFLINKFIKEKGIFSRVFVRKNLQKDLSDLFLGKSNEKIDVNSRKPQYIDFNNPILVKLFIKICLKGYDLILEEAYPDYTNTNCNVQERIYEVSYV